MQFIQIALGLDRDCAHSDNCPGLRLDSGFWAILMQFRRIASEFQPLAINRPRTAPDRNQTGTHPNWTGSQPTQNSRTAILTAIFTIELNCDNILKSWGLWWNCRFQAIQPQGPTYCTKIAWIAGQLRQLYATRGDQDQQSVEFAAILPHRLHFLPGPSHIVPTHHDKLITQSITVSR